MEIKLNQYIDHTLLKPFAKREDIVDLCAAARKWDFASVCVNPCYVALARKELEGSGVKVCTVIGFPLGANTTAIKAEETGRALADGCDEFDMVINIGAVKERRCDFVRADIAAVVAAAKGKTVKVILETFYLDDDEKALAAGLAAGAGAGFVKTCTGFNNGVATVHDVEIMKKAAAPFGCKVKASSGIRCCKDALALIEAGAERLGTSSGAKIIEEYRAEKK